MLSAIRAFAKSWVAALLIGLLIISFAVFGINDVFSGGLRDAVVKAGSRTVTSAEFKREFDNYRERLEQQMGRPITLEMADESGLVRRVLQGVAGREAFAELLAEIGIRPSDQLIVAEIGEIPAFFDQVSGRFDKATYEQRLGGQGLTPQEFEQIMRDELAQQHLATAFANGLRVPRAYSALGAIYALESRDVSYFAVDPQDVPQPEPPTDEQLTAFMKENAAQLTRPEFRVLTVVRFSPEQVTGELQVDEAEVRKRFEFRRDSLSTPETRTLVQIPAKDPATAERIAARLGAGEDPAAIAQSVGVDAVTYEERPQTAIADRRVGQAAFRMQPGQVQTVQGDLGLAVVQVVSATPGREVTLDEVRSDLEAEIRRDLAAERVYELTQAYDEAHAAGANLVEAAEKAGVPAVTLGPVSQQGRGPEGQPVEGLTQPLMETAFSLPAGGESDIVEAGNGEYFAVRVERIIPPAMPPLAEIRDQLARVWTMRELVSRMQARADELAARVREGESLQAVAASVGAEVQRAEGLDRQSVGENPAVSRDILSEAFASRQGEVFTADNARFGLVVGRLDAVRVREGPTLARMAEEGRPQMTEAFFGELADSAQTAAVREVKVRTDHDRARMAVGLQPAPEDGAAEVAR